MKKRKITLSHTYMRQVILRSGWIELTLSPVFGLPIPMNTQQTAKQKTQEHFFYWCDITITDQFQYKKSLLFYSVFTRIHGQYSDDALEFLFLLWYFKLYAIDWKPEFQKF